MKAIFACLLILAAIPALAQHRITGTVTDAQSGEALPFVSVYIRNSSIGTTTDAQGKFDIRLTRLPDSLTISFVGYRTQSKEIKKNVSVQALHFALTSNSTSLQEVLITPGENPAFRIMRQVIAHKKENDKRRLSAYQYEAYTKMQFSMDNLARSRNRLGMKQAITALVDTAHFLVDRDGKKVMPFFISEALSEFYYHRDPKRIKENIKASKVTGIGIKDGSLVAQVIGNSYQDYNFYQNWVSVLKKDFISPIAEGWKGYYSYELEDSLWVEDTWCYQLKVDQKRLQDLAFNGRIWIADSTFALKKIDVTVSKSANINFVESIHIQQLEAPTAAGAWLPVKTGIVMKIAKMSEARPGIIARINSSYRQVVVNRVQPPAFFDQPITLLDKANAQGESFWQARRHDTLTLEDRQVYAAIDSIRSSPRMKRFTELATVLATGYVNAGKFSFGPYPYTFAFNDVEGIRLQGGFKTNIDFSNKWELRGFAGYGTLDREWKYGGGARYIFSRRHWSEAGLSYKSDLQRVGFMTEKLAASPFFVGFSRFGNLRQPILTREVNAFVQRDILRGVTERIVLSRREFKPRYDFAYYKTNGEGERVPEKDFTTTELTLFTRLAKNELNVVNDNERISLGNGSWPVVTLKYTMGLKQALAADIGYHRLDAGLQQTFLMGRLGKTRYRLEAGKVFNPVPYPLLEVHLGNQSPFYYEQTFNLMRSFEFVSDTYASLHYEQYFEGLLFNRLPVIRKLKWRLLTTSNLLYGSLSRQNLGLMVPGGDSSPAESAFHALGRQPYAELGYGIENIFRVLRIDAFHRLTYLDNPGARKFGLKLSFQFKL